MTMKRIAGAVAAGVIAAGVATVPMGAAQAATSAPSVSAAPAAAQSATADRKKKKPKVSVAVAPNPAGCYTISIGVTKRGVGIPGAAVRVQSKSRGKWRFTKDAPIAMDATGHLTIPQGGLHNAYGGPSNDKVRFKYKHSYSRAFRAPCGS